jgi:hypothetical protein
MLTNNYKYLFCDATYIMRKNLAILQMRYDKEGADYDVGTAAKMIFWNAKKLIRDYESADCIVMCHDVWGDGGYIAGKVIASYQDRLRKEGRLSEIPEGYKADRKYYTEKDITDDMDDETKKMILSDAKRNKVKRELKNLMMNEFWKYGIINIGVPGYESDYLGYIFGAMTLNEDKRCGIVSRDSDWSFSSNPNVDLVKLPQKSGGDYEVVTYDKMIKSLDGPLPTGMSLYQYMGYRDALFGSHNNMTRTVYPGLDQYSTIVKVYNKDYSCIENFELFKVQLSTFDVDKYPKIQEVASMYYQIPTMGKLSNVSEFREFANKYKIDITDKYYKDFIDRLDPSLYRHE